MNSLFKIEKYKDNNKILVKFSDSMQTIDDAPSRIIDCRVLDTTDPHSFISSLMKLYGDGYIIEQIKLGLFNSFHTTDNSHRHSVELCD